MKLIIQMPCYNEAETLAIALSALPRKVEGFDTVEWLIIDELTQMANYDFITPEVFDSVSRLPIDMSNYGVRDHISGPATYFREILKMELREWCQNHVKSDGTPYDLYKDGLKIYTVQYSVDLPTGDIWSPRNSSSKRIGEEVTLQWALANSNNWISAFLIKRYSPQSIIKIARKIGVQATLVPSRLLHWGLRIFPYTRCWALSTPLPTKVFI